MLEIRCLF